MSKPAKPSNESAAGETDQKLLTIGQVHKTLVSEFDDLTISKIRFLEDKGLISPQRTQGKYRMFSESDIDALRLILRLQRDEFLPLRVIKQELAAGRGKEPAAAEEADSSTDSSILSGGSNRYGFRSGGKVRHSIDDVLQNSGATAAVIKDLRDHNIVEGQVDDGVLSFNSDELEIIRSAAQLARYRITGRHIQYVQRASGRESDLLVQMFSPTFKRTSGARKDEAIDALETIVATSTRLKHMMLIRDLRSMVSLANG